ncbi:MAG: hypothetical protein ACYCPT_13560, partial [Acidimicrobiales bacterium]
GSNFYSIKGCLCNIYKNKAKRVLQIILTKYANLKTEVINAFDCDVLQWIYCNVDGKAKLLGYPRSFMALKYMTSNVKVLIMRARHIVKRLCKLLKIGFSVSINNNEDFGYIKNIIKNEEMFMVAMHKINYWYYPDIDLNDADSVDNVESMIRKKDKVYWVKRTKPDFDLIEATDNFTLETKNLFLLYDKNIANNKGSFKHYNNTLVKLISSKMSIISLTETEIKLISRDIKFDRFITDLCGKQGNIKNIGMAINIKERKFKSGDECVIEFKIFVDANHLFGNHEQLDKIYFDNGDVCWHPLCLINILTVNIPHLKFI